MRFEMIAKTDIGRQRTRNEDNFLVLEEYALLVVADGMGGHVDGDLASKMAVNTIEEIYKTKHKKMLEDISGIKNLLKTQEEFLEKSVQQSNSNIFAQNKGFFSLEGMGTTVVALQLVDKYALTASVGDSRIYLLQHQQLQQITQDHSLVGELVRYNIIAEQDSLFLQNKNIITRALGMSEHVLVDTACRETDVGDIFLLCSDGLTDAVNNATILEILLKYHDNLEKASEVLIEEANNKGGHDNITVGLAKVNEL